MVTKYHCDFTNGGTDEDYDLDALKARRDQRPGGGIITALSVTHTVTNDPEGRIFDWADDADAAIRELADERFVREPHEVLIEPQPEGLND